MTRDIDSLAAEIAACRRCPRLVEWRERVAVERKKAFRDQDYWGRPVPGFGDAAARLLVVGLAPAAHGANRTGRMFTGDRSGDWLYRALFRAGFANRPESEHRDDGLRLSGVFVTAPVRCAPPANRPTTEERDSCAPWLAAELDLLPHARVAVCLGSFAWGVMLRTMAQRGHDLPRPRPGFGHGATARIGGLALVGSYHPSQQNTFTGRLTEEMFDEVFAAAKTILSDLGQGSPPF